MRTDVHGLAIRQHDMFGQPQGSFELPMTQAEICAELSRVLDELRAEQAATLVAAFETEMRRLR
ncbi:MAG: hypothetical protein ACKVOJ_11355 [Sphingomonadaceae bacterium]